MYETENKNKTNIFIKVILASFRNKLNGMFLI